MVLQALPAAPIRAVCLDVLVAQSTEVVHAARGVVASCRFVVSGRSFTVPACQACLALHLSRVCVLLPDGGGGRGWTKRDGGVDASSEDVLPLAHNAGSPLSRLHPLLPR